MNAITNWWNEVASGWWAWSVHGTWQGFVVLALALAVVAAWRRATPRWRYALLLVVLVKFAIPPVIPSRFGLFEWLGEAGRRAAPVPAAGRDPAHRWTMARGAGVLGNSLRFVEGLGAGSGDETVTAPVQSSTEQPTHAVSSNDPEAARLTPAGAAFAIYCAACGALAFIVAAQARKLRKRHQSAAPVDTGPLLDLAVDTARRLGMRNTPALCISDEAPSPYAGGLLRPFVVLPGWAAEIVEDEQRILLAHELAHLRRNDPQVNWFQIAVQIVLLWNPVVWWLNRRIRAERELCCDDLVLARGLAESAGYSHTLVHVAERMTRRQLLMDMTGMADSFRPIKQRIRRALDAGLKRPVRLSAASVILLLLIAAFVLPGGTLEPTGGGSSGNTARRKSDISPAIVPREVFALGKGENREIDTSSAEDLTVKPGRIRKQDYTNELVGHVLTAERTSVKDARVFLGNTEVSDEASNRRDRTWEGGGTRPAYVDTNADGLFSFNLLYEGYADIWAEHPVFGRAWLRDIGINAQDIALLLEPQPETLAFAGAVLGASGEPLANADLRLYGDHYQRRSLLFKTVSDSTGRFEIEATPPEVPFFRYLTLVCTPGNGAVTWKLLPYCSAGDIQIRTRQPGTLSGRVTNSEGEALGDATVEVYSIRHSDYGHCVFLSREMRDVARRVRTDADGHFTMTGLPMGSEVALYADHESHGCIVSWRSNVEGTTNVSEKIALPGGIAIEGTVRYAGTDEPARGVSVRIHGAAMDDLDTVSDEKGHYIFPAINKLGWEMDTSFVVGAESGETPPAWTGTRVIEKADLTSTRNAGIDIVLSRSLESRQEQWKEQAGKPLASLWRIAVLDDADPAFDGKAKYNDTLTAYNSEGVKQWQVDGLNICQSVGANHALAWNPVEHGLWAVESVGNRLLKLSQDGMLVWEKEMAAHALATEPKTGEVWGLTTTGTIYGEDVRVFAPSGELIHQWDVGAFDIAYSPNDDCFWLVGKKVYKVDKRGQILYESPQEFAWCAVCVAVNDLDGSVWVGEDSHSQVAGSSTRILILSSDGTTRNSIKLETGAPNSIAVDARRGCAWVGTANGLLKLTLEGEIVADIPLRGFSVAVEPDTGYVWVTDRDGVYRLDTDGLLVWSDERPGGSQKWLCVIK